VHILPEKDVVLLGIGHTNAHVLRMWAMHRPPSARLTCVALWPVATYSGMLPGVLSGQYPPDAMEVDLVRLCAAAGARLILDETIGLDVDARCLRLRERPPVPFDVLSVGIGSVPSWAGVEVVDASRVLAIKPMQTLLARLDAHLSAAAASDTGTRAGGRGAFRVVVVGAGAGGVEIALCLPARVRARLGARTILQQTLVSADGRLVPDACAGTIARVARVLESRGVTRRGGRVVRVDGSMLTLDSGPPLEADLVIWATGATAPPVLGALGLPTDARGFLATDASLRSVSGHPVFAVGDSGAIEGAPVPKAGVYAVRQAPVLWANIRHLLAKEPLERYVPQRGFLKLLNSGDGRAIGEWKGLSFEGAWAWGLKDRIDRRFIAMYQSAADDMDQATMAGGPNGGDRSAALMRCVGCGGKVAGSVLSRALARLDVPPNEHVRLGLEAADDAAVVRAGGGGDLVVTVDAFAAPFDDPYLVGRVALLNAASDAFAMGAAPWGALAMVTLPVGPARQQEELLYQLMAGALAELRAMGATLVGGHTIEGPVLSVGFTILASPGASPPLTKGSLRPGDRLVVTKALGTGVLLAAHMRARCRAAWWPPLMQAMLMSNESAAAAASSHSVSGLTDVTGFGLAGHLLEMLTASRVSVRLDLATVPLLPGAEILLAEGLESTLAPANRDAEAAITVGEASLSATARYRALFDPQTGGGLLIGVAGHQADALVASLVARGYTAAAVIGDVVPVSDLGPRITLR
jgi:selenide,water dikinase